MAVMRVERGDLRLVEGVDTSDESLGVILVDAIRSGKLVVRFASDRLARINEGREIGKAV